MILMTGLSLVCVGALEENSVAAEVPNVHFEEPFLPTTAENMYLDWLFFSDENLRFPIRKPPGRTS
jgi:hypothetical protein